MTLRRGACPSLSEPMQTGDGLLARLNPVEGRLSGRQLAGLSRAAERFGNGILEITARGSLQVRGLTAESAAGLGAEVAALGIEVRSGLPVDVGPLAGLDTAELSDPRALAREIRERAEALTARLGPKVSVTVDGGGMLGLGGLMADVKLEAVAGAEGSGEAGRDLPGGAAITWLLRVGGTAATARMLGHFSETEAAEITIRILHAVAAHGHTARARDLSDAELVRIAGREPLPTAASVQPPRSPVGSFALSGGGRARGFALAYGQIGCEELAVFAEALGNDRQVRLAPGRGLIVLSVKQDEDAALIATARRLGLVTDPSDPRLSIAVCAGKPACASAHLATRRLADRLAAMRPDLLDGAFTLHVSGCEKQCARPSGPSVTLRGTGTGYDISAEGATISPELQAALSALADEQLEPSP